jgi:hypothetical protein
MSNPNESAGKSNNSRPVEQEAVCTTIVGGRPPGCGQAVGPISRGIEILIKKAAVDEDFKLQLLENCAEAAESIGLQLQPAEAMMLAAVPASQLEAIIAQTTVPQEHRRVFLGQVAAAMLAVLGMFTSGCREQVKGIRPEVKGSRPEIDLKEEQQSQEEKPLSDSSSSTPEVSPDKNKSAEKGDGE